MDSRWKDSTVKHTEESPLSGETVKIVFAGKGHPQLPGSEGQEYDFVVEDWWDHLTDKSWMVSNGNPACMIYGIRGGLNGLPTDDEVLYGKIGHFGHLVHISELVNP